MAHKKASKPQPHSFGKVRVEIIVDDVVVKTRQGCAIEADILRRQKLILAKCRVECLAGSDQQGVTYQVAGEDHVYEKLICHS